MSILIFFKYILIAGAFLVICCGENLAQEGEPQPDEFVPVQKEPEIDLNALSRRVVYPDMAKRANIEGKVVVQVLIDKEGNPVKTRIMQSASTLLNDAAIMAVMGGKYKPAIQNEKPIASWVAIPITFKLRDGEIPANPLADIMRLTQMMSYDSLNRSDLLYERGRLYYQMGEYIMAKRDYLLSSTKKDDYEQMFLKKVVQTIHDSSNVSLWLARASSYEANYLPGYAVEDYSRALLLEPERYSLYQNRAANYMRLAKYEMAISDLKKLLKHDSLNIVAAEKLARAYMKLEKTKPAAPYIEKVMRHHPNNAAIMYLSAMRHLIENDFDTAKELYEDAHELPQNEITRFEAIKDLRELFQKNIKLDEIQYILREIFAIKR